MTGMTNRRHRISVAVGPACILCRITFELTGQRRWDALAHAEKMYRVLSGRAKVICRSGSG